MELKLAESNVVEFSTEVARITGSFHSALVYQAIRHLAPETDGSITAEDIASYLEYPDSSLNAIRKKFSILEGFGLVDYLKGNRHTKPHFTIIQDHAPDTDLDMKWKCMERMSLRDTWLMTNLEYIAEPITMPQFLESCEGLLDYNALSIALGRLTTKGLLFHDKNCFEDDRRLGTFELSAEAYDLSN